MESVDVAVIGGGIAGLACAHRLHTLDPELRVIVLEAAGKPGGKIKGEVVNGCIVDGGPDLCVASKLEKTRLYESLSLGSRLIPVNPRRLPTFTRSGSEMSRLPTIIGADLATLPLGMHELVDLIAASLGRIEIRTGAQVESVDHYSGGWNLEADGGSITARAIVSAVPAGPFATLFGRYSGIFADAVSDIRYDPITTVSAAWASADVPAGLSGTGFISANLQSGEVSACTFTSLKIPSRSPEGVLLVRGYCRSPDPDASRIKVLSQLADILGVSSEPLFTRSFAWSDGLPRYAEDHASRVGAIAMEAEKLGGLAIAGAAFHGVGIGDCISSGERAAGRVHAGFRNEPLLT